MRDTGDDDGISRQLAAYPYSLHEGWNDRLKWVRQEAAFKLQNPHLRSQKGMAEQMGVSRQSVGRWETGIIEPTARQLELWCRLTNSNPAWIMWRQGEAFPFPLPSAPIFGDSVRRRRS